jgi:hypothetical protein
MRLFLEHAMIQVRQIVSICEKQAEERQGAAGICLGGGTVEVFLVRCSTTETQVLKAAGNTRTKAFMHQVHRPITLNFSPKFMHATHAYPIAGSKMRDISHWRLRSA